MNMCGLEPKCGMRRWLLLPKLVAISVLLGGLVSAAAIIHSAQPLGLEQWVSLTEVIRRLFRIVIVPAVLVSLLLGILLLSRQPVVFLKMRWMQAKLVLLLVLPALHFRARYVLELILEELQHGRVEKLPALMSVFATTIDAAILLVLFVFVLGRCKPRLGGRAGGEEPNAVPPQDSR